MAGALNNLTVVQKVKNPSGKTVSGAAMIEPIGRVALNLCLLGTRNYVNGLTQLEEALAAYRAVAGTAVGAPVRVKSFEMTAFLRSQATASLYETGSVRGSDALRTSVSRLDLHSADGDRTVLLHADPAAAPRVEEYDRDQYIAAQETTADGGSFATLTNIDSYTSLVRGVVEINHRFVTTVAREQGIDRRISWAWMRNMPWLGDAEAAEIGKVRFRYGKAITIGDRRYVIRYLDLDPSANADGVEFAFFY